MIVWIVSHAALAVAYAFVCHGVGRLFLRNNTAPPPARRERRGRRVLSLRDAGAPATALGYGILGQLVFVLASFGVLTRVNVMALFAIAIVVSLPTLRERPEFSKLHALIAIGSLPSLLIAMYPPVGYDTTMYHLVYARLFSESGRLVFADALRFPVFPQLAEMHYTAALLLFGDHAAQLTQWLALPVTAFAIATIVRQAGGGERAQMFAAALWLGTPYAVYLSGSGYIDVSLAMFVTLAIASTTSSTSGAFAGMAAATKYHGLFFVFALLWRRPRVLAYLAAALLFAAPWYVHIARTTGNPVFPYLRGVFGDHEYRTHMDQSLLDVVHQPSLAARYVPRDMPFISIVRHAIVEPMQTGRPPHSPVLVLLLPLAIAAAVIAPSLRRPLVIAAIYAIVFSPLDWRFMIVIVPLLGAAIGIVLERLLPARFALIATIVFILPGFAWGSLLMLMKYGPMPHTASQRETFLGRKIAVYRAVRTLGPTTVYVLRAPQMAYYCPGQCLGDQNGPHRWSLVEPLLNDPPKLAQQLRRFGATHFVIDKTNTHFIPAPPFRLVYDDANAVSYAIDR